MKNRALKSERKPFFREQRDVLLSKYFAAQQSLNEVSDLADRASGLEAVRLTRHQQFYMERLLKLREEYTAGVPVIPLSRCPFTGEVMSHSIDHFDLDGLWWNYEAAVRPKEELPSTYFALVGAVRLTGKIPWFPFLCKPGPEVPYVVPRLLQHPAVLAVLSSVTIGEHQGYAITYFAHPIPHDLPRLNTWGTNEYAFLDEKGEVGWDAQPEDPGEFDFNLEPWVASGQLRWIAPGDKSLTLRDSVADCPYLELAGRQTIARIQGEKVWWS